ncbi:MAG: hypothetical protein WA154_07580 [Moraxellaceae bacterium]
MSQSSLPNIDTDVTPSSDQQLTDALSVEQPLILDAAQPVDLAAIDLQDLDLSDLDTDVDVDAQPVDVSMIEAELAVALSATAKASPWRHLRHFRHLRHTGAVLHAASLGARELTHLVAEMHGTITRLPSPINRDYQAELAHAPFPYRIVAGLFDKIGQKARYLSPQDNEADGIALQAQAVLNGVSGDKLADWNSSLAFELSLRDVDGQRLAGRDWVNASSQGHVLLIHGLCGSDQDWNNPAARQLIDQLQATGDAVAWLRYNTGQSIAENGRALDALLQQCFAGRQTPLRVLGYSMGGLLIRSACYWAEQHGHDWVKNLSHVACLGTPHLGAPAERLGNMANGLLGFTPYTKPLARLGNIRSRGIKDLSHGWINPEHLFTLLPAQTQVLLIAAAISARHEGNLVGDGLVPVRSAFAEYHGQPLLTGKMVQRRLISNLAHIPIVSDVRVFQAVQEWLQQTHGLPNVLSEIQPVAEMVEVATY